MKFVVFSCLLGLILLNFPGCLSNVKQDVSTEEEGITSIDGDLIAIKTGGETVFSAFVEDIFEDDTVITGNINLTNLYDVLNFKNWYYGSDDSMEVTNITLESFANVQTNEYMIESPYFWIAFWNGYEQHKHKSGSNNLSETIIKRIFQTYTSNSNKAFVESILDFAEKASKVKSMSTQRVELISAINDLKKGGNASNPVTNFENLLLNGLQYSMNKTLQKCNVIFKSDSNEFDFKKDESIKNVNNAMRGLIILKGSIEKKMLPTLTNNKTNVAAAVTAQSNHIKKIDTLIKKVEDIFVVTNPYKVYTIYTTEDFSSCILVLTDEELANINASDIAKKSVDSVFIPLNSDIDYEILDGIGLDKDLHFLKRITNTTNRNNSGLIPILISNARKSRK